MDNWEQFTEYLNSELEDIQSINKGRSLLIEHYVGQYGDAKKIMG